MSYLKVLKLNLIVSAIMKVYKTELCTSYEMEWKLH